MSNTNRSPGMIYRCMMHSKASLSRLFSRIPNLASDPDNTRKPTHSTDNTENLNDWYGNLLAKIHQEPNGKKLANAEQLQQAVTEIVCKGKRQMANAESTEEIMFTFMAGMYKIKSLLLAWTDNQKWEAYNPCEKTDSWPGYEAYGNNVAEKLADSQIP